MSAKHRSIRISRRRFLTGAAMAAGGVASLSMLAACTPAALPTATSAPTVTPTTEAPTTTGEWPDHLSGKTGPAKSGGIMYLAGAPMTQPHLSPFRTPGGTINGVMGILGSMLVHRDFAGTGLEYGLAESHQEVEPNRVFEFKLRENAKWHDGHPVTADDVVYTFYLYAHKDVAHPFQLTEIKGAKDLKENGGGVEKLTGVTKVDDYTVRFELEEPQWNWVFLKLAGVSMSYNILPAHILSTVTPDNVYDFTAQMPPIPMSGPFKFKQYVQDQYLELERFDDYYLGKPYLDEIIMRILSPDALEAALEVGEIDFASGINSEAAVRLSQLPHLSAVPWLSPDTMGMELHHTKFKDIHLPLSQALVLALDRETIVKEFGYGMMKLTNYIWDSVPWWNPPPEGLNPYLYNPQQAKDVLTQAGWDFSQELKWYAWYPPTAMHTFMMQQWNDIGLKVIWDQGDVSQVMAKLYEKAEFDMYYNSVAFRFDPAQTDVSYGCDFTYASGKGWNNSGFCDPKVDEYYPKVRAAALEGGLDAMRPIVQDFAKYWNETLPVGVYWRQGELFLYNKRLNMPYPIWNPRGYYALNAFHLIWLSA